MSGFWDLVRLDSGSDAGETDKAKKKGFFLENAEGKRKGWFWLQSKAKCSFVTEK